MTEPDETATLWDKSYRRTLEPVNKAGFTEGATEGQTSTFQPSFDKGYQLGFKFGFDTGFKDGTSNSKEPKETQQILCDIRKINCQLCLDKSLLEQDIEVIQQAQINSNKNHTDKNKDVLKCK